MTELPPTPNGIYTARLVVRCGDENWGVVVGTWEMRGPRPADYLTWTPDKRKQGVIRFRHKHSVDGVSYYFDERWR